MDAQRPDKTQRSDKTADRRTLLGMLTPSSNTILEPVCADIMHGLPGISVHFSRFTVTEISNNERAQGQFSYEPMLEAASLLADARVDTICWNGTSASWLGIDRDVALCEKIEEQTGIRSTSAVLAMMEALRLFGAKRVGLVTPYIDGIQSMINANLEKEGVPVVADEHLGLSENFAFSLVGEAQLADMTRRVARARPDAIAILCTNLNGARVAAALEPELGIPVLDSISLAVWGSMRAAAADTSPLAEWGRLFTLRQEDMVDA